MTHRIKLFTPGLLLAISCAVSAQGLRLGTSATPLSATPAPSEATATKPSDYIVAVVNSEPITYSQVQREIQRVRTQLLPKDAPPPDEHLLAQEVLESLIGIKAQLHFARENGIQVDTAAIDQAEQNIAVQNKFDVAELRRRLARDGISESQFRSELRDQLTLQRVREREVDSRVRVSDTEIDQYFQEQLSNADPSAVQINLAQILVAVPESATATQVQALQKRAQRAHERARAGEDFAKLVSEFTDVTDPGNGGQMGLREANRYPESFVAATRALGVGDVAELVRSAAGFHIIKVIEKAASGLPVAAVTQSHARHILLLPNANLSQSQAHAKLLELKAQLMAGKADFAALARLHSQDGSAAQGGDLGWSSPGMFVPEFDEALNRLAPGEISAPLVSRFGVHLIQLLERRKMSLSTEQQREAVRNMLRERKLDDAYKSWLADVRGKAYVEMREQPQ